MIICVTGTGTGIGKTHVACALVGALRDRGVPAVGFKPVESGVDGSVVTDEQLLLQASTSPAHAEGTPRPTPALPPTIRLRAPLAPNVAARLEGVPLDADAIARTVLAVAARYTVVLELAGGLFSPLTDDLDNAAFLAPLRPWTIVVAPDRLGVIHDVTATVRAAAPLLAIHQIVLCAPAVADASTGTNARELRLGVPVSSVPRAPITELRRHGAITALAAQALQNPLSS